MLRKRKRMRCVDTGSGFQFVTGGEDASTGKRQIRRNIVIIVRLTPVPTSAIS